jgi:hypothetical protein
MDGREAPNVYTIKSLNAPIAVNLVCAVGIGERDVDGSTVSDPVYLMAFVPIEVRREKVQHVTFQMAVYNPQELTYQFLEQYVITYKNGDEIEGESVAGQSYLKSREFFRNLPIDEDIEKVIYRVILRTENGDELLRAGDFIYRLL